MPLRFLGLLEDLKIIFVKSYYVCVSGISGKSQVLFALVFTTRYLDLFTSFISIYNTVMKVKTTTEPISPHKKTKS